MNMNIYLKELINSSLLTEEDKQVLKNSDSKTKLLKACSAERSAAFDRELQRTANEAKERLANKTIEAQQNVANNQIEANKQTSLAKEQTKQVQAQATSQAVSSAADAIGKGLEAYFDFDI